jgi:hypothetical protein
VILFNVTVVLCVYIKEVLYFYHFFLSVTTTRESNHLRGKGMLFYFQPSRCSKMKGLWPLKWNYSNWWKKYYNFLFYEPHSSIFFQLDQHIKSTINILMIDYLQIQTLLFPNG